MLCQSWANVGDGGPTLVPHWLNVSRLWARRMRRERSEERGVPWPEVNFCQGRWVALIAHSALYCVTPWTLEIWSFQFKFAVTWSCVSLPRSTISSYLKFVKLGQIFHYTTFHLHKWKNNHRNTTKSGRHGSSWFPRLTQNISDRYPISDQYRRNCAIHSLKYTIRY